MTELGEISEQKFDDGLYCAESVLLTIAEALGLEEKILPGVATGFCSGVSRTGGMCGALSGAIMSLGLTSGRRTGEDDVSENYLAVQELLSRFEAEFGSTNCTELLDCDISSKEGLRAFEERGLAVNCRSYTGAATRLAAELMKLDGTDRTSDRA